MPEPISLLFRPSREKAGGKSVPRSPSAGIQSLSPIATSATARPSANLAAHNVHLPTTNYQLSTINYQLSTINYQLPTINYLPAISSSLTILNCPRLFRAIACSAFT